MKIIKFLILGFVVLPIFLQYALPHLPPAGQRLAADLGLIKPFDSYIDAEFEDYEDDYDDDNDYAYDDYDTESDW